MVAFLCTALLASTANSPSSRLQLSRVADASAILSQQSVATGSGDEVLRSCVPERLQCLRGGATGTKCDVILVGCGVPKRGMGCMCLTTP